MAILRYTCPECGIVTRVEEGQAYKACACREVPFVVNEEEEAASANGE